MTKDKSYSSFDNIEVSVWSLSSEDLPNGGFTATEIVQNTGEHAEGVIKKGIFDTRAKKMILGCISMYWFISCCSYSMIAPFFPGEADKKGASVTIIGMIFAVFPLVMFLGSPVVGVLIPFVGTKLLLILGLILEGGTQVLFGFLDLIPDGDTFISFSFVIRIVSAMGGTMTSTCSLTLLTQTFKDNISPAVGILETFGGFGMMAGPPIGGLLYSIGGFKLPFLVIGSIALISLIPICFILPADDVGMLSNDGKKILLGAAKTPAIAVIAVTVAVSGMAMSFLDPSLQKHLEEPFHLNSLKVGFIFLIGPSVYALTAPVFGIIADKSDTRILLCTGAIIGGFSFPLLGPPPFLSSKIFPTALWLNCVALGFSGIGISLLLVPALADMNASARRYGLPEGLSTHSAISSIFNSMLNIGAIAGPSFGALLVQHLSFAWATSIFGLSIIFVGLLVIVFTIFQRRSAGYVRSIDVNDDL